MTLYFIAKESGKGSGLIATIAASSTPSPSKSAVISGVGNLAGNVNVAPNCCLTIAARSAFGSAAVGCETGAAWGAFAGDDCPPAMQAMMAKQIDDAALLMGIISRVYQRSYPAFLRNCAVASLLTIAAAARRRARAKLMVTVVPDTSAANSITTTGAGR